MRSRILVAAMIAVLALSACENSKQKAEKHYQAAMEFIEKGDAARAEVELKNVFRFNGSHYEARLKLADLLEKKGDVRGSYSQLLRLAEQYPEDAPVRRRLAAMAADFGNWEEAERHGRLAAQLDPDNTEQQGLNLILDYRKAVMDKDAAARQAAVEKAKAAQAATPGDIGALRILISEALESKDQQTALPYVDALLTAQPEKLETWMLKLGLLADAGDDAASEAHLARMIETFPDRPEVRATQAAWYVESGQIDKAEAVLREIASAAGKGSAENLALIKFIEQHRGTEAALAEADRLSADAADKPADQQLYDSLRAFYLFNAGKRDEAMTILETALAKAEPSDQTNRMRSMLAGMRMKTGDREGATKLVDEVLAADATNVFALRVKAEGLLAQDKADEAIQELRRALDQAPRDIDTLALLASAYERAGNSQLMGETLASAVDISGSAPGPSLRYADFLIRENRASAARSVIEDAVTANPRDIGLLVRAAQMAMQDNAFARVSEIIALLNAREGDAEAVSAAQALQADMMIRQGHESEGLALLEQRAANFEGNVAAAVAVIRARLAAGQVAEARSYLDGLLAASPEDLDLKVVNAGLLIAENRGEEAEAALREVIAKRPDVPGPVQLLYGRLLSTERADEAQALLDEALTRMPEDRGLNLIQAGAMERAGRIDEAIAIFDKLYAADSGNMLLANNLASMLATWRGSDPASLARATAAAQRLKDAPLPPFQDTYGWILHLNGKSAEALPYLENAATGLSQDPLVQFHLGMVQAAVGRKDEARASLGRALDLAGDRDLPQMAEADSKLAELGGRLPDAGGAAAEPAPAATETAPVTAPVAPAPAATGGANLLAPAEGNAQPLPEIAPEAEEEPSQ